MQLDLPLGETPPPAPGFESEAAFAKALSDWQTGLKARSGTLRAARVATPLGEMVCVCDHGSLYLLEFADRPELPREMAELAKLHGKILAGRTQIAKTTDDQLAAYFNGDRTTFDLPLHLTGSDFAKTVWHQLCAIPYGTTTSYGALAETLNSPTATRAVARANGANRIAIVVPCHRVIGADGSLTGYAGGLERKRALLALEASRAP